MVLPLLSLALTASIPQPIAYRMGVDVTGAAPALRVEVRFRGDPSGRTVLDLPDHWAGSDHLYRGLSDLAVTGGVLAPGTDAAHRTIRHAPSARLVLRYRVRDARPGPPEAWSYEKARPVVKRDWFYVHAEGAVIIPHGREDAPATFAWATPPRWHVASDLDGSGKVLTANQIGGAVMIGGTALRLSTRSVGGQPLRLAMLGRWSFGDGILLDRVAAIVAAETAGLGAPVEPYLVTLAPLTGGSERGRISYGGTGRTHGFALTSTNNVPLADLTFLLAHEYGHRWFGGSFGPSEDGAADYWFSEGFTDWNASAALVRAGYWTVVDWAAGLNKVLRRYGSSHARALDDAELTRRFWTDQDAMQIPYDRGHLTALLMDTRLGAGSVLGLLRRMAAAPAAGGEREPARFGRLADAAFPGALAAARATAERPLPPTALATCGTLETVEQPSYARGYDLDAADDVVTTVAPDGPAWRAGVRPGMRYLRRVASDPDDSTVPYVADFGSGRAVIRLRWLPAGRAAVVFQRLALRTPDAPECRALVAGSVPAP